MPVSRPRAVVVVAAGIVLSWAAHGLAPSAVAPLFDGVFVEDPYRYVDPPVGAAGDPLPVQVTQPVSGGAVPLLAVATVEVPPQAQMIAQADAFEISPDVSSLIVTITPSEPSDGQVTGNVYTFSVTDQDGSALAVLPSALVTIVLRAPQTNPQDAQIARRDGVRWLLLPTDYGGLPDVFSANVDQLGDYALVLTGASASGSATESSAAMSSPVPSPTPAGPDTVSGAPLWILVLLVVGAVGIGVGWGFFAGGDRGSPR
jgi:hypothetical protein